MKKLAILAVLGIFLLGGVAAQSNGVDYSSQYKLLGQDTRVDDFTNKGEWTVVSDGSLGRLYHEEEQVYDWLAAPTLTGSDSISLSNRWIVYDRPSNNQNTVGLLSVSSDQDGARQTAVYGFGGSRWENPQVAAGNDYVAWVVEDRDQDEYRIARVPNGEVQRGFPDTSGDSDCWFFCGNESETNDYYEADDENILQNASMFPSGEEPIKAHGNEIGFVYTDQTDNYREKLSISSSTTDNTVLSFDWSVGENTDFAFNNKYIAVMEDNQVTAYRRGGNTPSEIYEFQTQGGETFDSVAIAEDKVIVYTSENMAVLDLSTGQRTNLFGVSSGGMVKSDTQNQYIYQLGDDGLALYVDRLAGVSPQGSVSSILDTVFKQGFGVPSDSTGVASAFLLMLLSTATLGYVAGGTGAGVGFLGATGLSAITGLIPGWIAFALGIIAAALIARAGGGSVSGRGA